MEHELKSYRHLANHLNNSIENKIFELETKEKNYMMLCSPCNYKFTLGRIDERTRIQNEYNHLQTSLLIELFRKLLRAAVPIEIRFFESKNFLELKSIYDFKSVNELIETIFQNQITLNKLYNFQVTNDVSISFPFQVYMFYEQLKSITFTFKEFLGSDRKLNNN